MNDEIKPELDANRRHLFADRRTRDRSHLKNTLFAEVSNGVVAEVGADVPAWNGHNPVGVGDILRMLTQGSSFLATLGFGTQPRWG